MKNLPITDAPPKRTQPSSGGPSRYWRSLDELDNTPQFQEFLAREFPVAASEFPAGVSRRRWMQLMGASFALAGAAGCRWETEKIVPFAERPEGYVPGASEHYATNISWAGEPKHLLVTKVDGRPIKIEGNPEHPASRGAADAYSQACTLSLYDPDRLSGVYKREGGKGFSKEWSDFEAFLAGRREAFAGGAGLAVLFPPLESRSLFAAVDRLARQYPSARFYEHTPLSRENELAGAELALGERLRTHYRLADAKVIATFDCDLLGLAPDSLRAARDYAEGRDPDGVMNRLYSVESQFSTTGATADHRLPVKSSAIGGVLAMLRDRVKQLQADPSLVTDEKIEGQPTVEQFVDVLAGDLAKNAGAALVAVGPGQPAEVHAIAHEINSIVDAVGATVLYTSEPAPEAEIGSLADLTRSLNAGDVDTLFILDGNPAYDAPGDVAFAEAIGKAAHSVRLGLYEDETARLCEWALPETHPLEQWGDVIGWDGAVGVTQPMIEPLLGGLSKLGLLAKLAGDTAPNTERLVKDTIAEAVSGMDDDVWAKLLHDGLAGDFQPELVNLSLTGSDFPAPEAPAEGALELVFTPSSSTYDGRLANNGWMQEAPDFLTKLTWDNAAIVSPATANDLGLKQGELVRLTVGETAVNAPVYILPGQAAGSIGLALGYGRTAAGRVGGLLDARGKAERGKYANGILALWLPVPADPVGVDAYPLRSGAGGWFTTGVATQPTGKPYLLATTQDHHTIDQMGMEAIGDRTGVLVRGASQEYYEEHNDFAPRMSHDVVIGHGEHAEPTEPLWQLPSYDGHAWGMAIDLNKCIGCNACVVACQAENNIPVVGKDQVSRGREMHWIRIDRYFKGVANTEDATDPANFVNPEVAHQPVACQQCETAPCEQVCPVAATTHSDEGLNDMAYNRCIGTRYCGNNCPYKVRKFNYFRYTKELYEANNELMKLVINPEVTVRSRGVMEKCTYCTQRISAARIAAKNEARPIRDGEIQAACQQACATRAIDFGDLNDPESRVAKAHANPRAYGILTELMTKPRTNFLAKIRNPHPRLARPEQHEDHSHGGHDAHNEEHEEAMEEAAHT
ncbi:Tetrathionate reductase subunit B precursor [Pseudobythopirellula maris]|uniref:Tetrathionate reductase subunit B n=1 Tax=Pseudobythopirellula maris TaxID=2527991 RepID=A0A5C5ZP40_9BACT|nr:TAT-variant-translocated molybdopterin oxidoreductase [Pseudobythopirellula maris]TWT88865.1 Tetrathionate reductase subunit B precursor [Pseudobythopirellula maris]